MEFNKENLVEYIRWLLAELDKMDDNISKSEARTMLLSIIGEMYR